MKHLSEFIRESASHFLVSKKAQHKYAYAPENKKELDNIISKRIKEEGIACNLNDIDVSNITDMSMLFARQFNGDISEWDVSNVEDMEKCFWASTFNGDISKWNVSNVKNMNSMFLGSPFNGDISEWDVSNVKQHDNVFDRSPLKRHPEKQCKFKD